MVRSPTLTEVISSAKLMLAASAAATKLTVSVTQPPPTGSGLTMADELLNNGGITWLSWFVIPSLNWQGIQFVLTDFGTCPHWASYQQVSTDELDVLGVASEPQTLISHPVAGTRSLNVGAAYVPVNCTPGIVANESLSHVSSSPAFKLFVPAGLQFPWATPPVNAFSAFGAATVVYQGKQYQAIGSYERYTYVSAHDPSPGNFHQDAWVDNTLFTFQMWTFGVGSTPSFQTAQIWWKDTQQMETITTQGVAVSITGTCPNFVYSLITSRGTLVINVQVAKFAVGSCAGGLGFGFGPSSSAIGGKTYLGASMTSYSR